MYHIIIQTIKFLFGKFKDIWAVKVPFDDFASYIVIWACTKHVAKTIWPIIMPYVPYCTERKSKKLIRHYAKASVCFILAKKFDKYRYK